MHVHSCTIIKEVTQASWPWRHAWLRTIFGPPLCHLVALQVGLRAHNKIFFSKLFEILVFITCLKDTQIFFGIQTVPVPTKLRRWNLTLRTDTARRPWGLAGWGEIWTTPCGPAPPSSEKPAMAYTSSENWQKYDVNCIIMWIM